MSFDYQDVREKMKAKGCNDDLESDDCEIEDENIKHVAVNRVWLPAEGVIVSDPEFYPDVVTEFLMHKSTSKMKDLNDRIRKHLLYLGWKIEYLKEEYNMTRMRYTSPGGKIYMSLVKVCEAMSVYYYGIQSRKVVIDRPEEDNSRKRNVRCRIPISSGDPVFEPEYCPEAIENWCKFAKRSSMNGQSGGELSSLKAKKHLSAVGWKFTYCYKVDKRELRYWSPNGKCFYSLITACEACTKNDGDSNPQQLTNDSLRQPKLLVDNQVEEEKRKGIESTRVVVRPRKRVREQPILSWLIDHNAVLPGALVQYMSRKNQPLKEGLVFREGIRCKCCDAIYTLSAFEAHAGSTAHRPSANIFLQDGRSLKDCQSQMLNKDTELNKEI
ncbi:unnamed protein product [Rhodiola kirilowii]